MNAGKKHRRNHCGNRGHTAKDTHCIRIDTMDYLYKGGRCTALQAIFGSMLQIRPVINVREDGTLGVLDKVRGSRKKALDRLLKGFGRTCPMWT